jgi:hypothetical protein
MDWNSQPINLFSVGSLILTPLLSTFVFSSVLEHPNICTIYTNVRSASCQRMAAPIAALARINIDLLILNTIRGYNCRPEVKILVKIILLSFQWKRCVKSFILHNAVQNVPPNTMRTLYCQRNWLHVGNRTWKGRHTNILVRHCSVLNIYITTVLRVFNAQQAVIKQL